MNKKIVKTLGLASVLGASTAMGSTVIGGASQPLLTIGTQTLNTGALTTGAGVNLGKTWYNIVDNTSVSTAASLPVQVSALDMTVTPGFAVATTGTYYMKLDLTNAIIKTQPIANIWGIDGSAVSTASLASGGAAGASTAIYLMTNSGSASNTTSTVSIPFVDLAVLGTAPVTSTLTFYSTLAQATNAIAGTSIGTKTQNYVAFADVATPTATATQVVTNVAENFK